MKKTLRKILSLVLVFVMTLSLTNIGYADDSGIMPCGGTETWYAGDGLVGSFTLEGDNLTPVKTMGASGKLRVYGTAESNNNGNPWWIRVQIKDAYSGKVLAESNSIFSTDSLQAYSVSLNVTKGQQIRVYMYYVTKPTNDAHIDLCYMLGN